MKMKLFKGLTGLLAAATLLASAIGVTAKSEVFEYYGLQEGANGYRGSITATVQIPQGEGKATPIEDMEFEVYQIWTLGEDGSFSFQAPFQAHEFLTNLDGSSELTAAQARALTEVYEAASEKATVYTTYEGKAITDATGTFTIADLPYGGYLFVPESSVSLEHEVDGKVVIEEFTASTFLATVPMLQTKGTGGAADVFTDKVNASVKVSAVGEKSEYPTVKLSKQSVSGEELPGAQLSIYNAATNELAFDVNGKELRWISTTTPHEVEMKPGFYRMVEISPPDNYYPATDVHFMINQDYTIDIVDKNGKAYINAVKGDGTSITGDTTGKGVAMPIMIDEAIPTPTPTETPTPTPTETPTPTDVKPATETPTPTVTRTPTPKVTTPPGGSTTTRVSSGGTTTTSKTTTASTVRTGDDTNNLPWIILLVVAAVALVGFAVVKKRRNAGTEE